MAAAGKSRRSSSQKRSSSKNRVQAGAGSTKEVISISQEIFLLVSLCVAILLFLGCFGIGGRLTDVVTEALFGTFGITAYLFPFVLFLGIFFIVMGEHSGRMVAKVFAIIAMFLSICVLLQMFSGEENAFTPKDVSGFYRRSMIFKKGGGVFGGAVYFWMDQLVGAGTAVICIGLILLSLIILTRKSIFKSLREGRRRVVQNVKKVADSGRRDADLREKRAQLRRQERHQKKEDDIEYRHQTREIQYRLRQQKRQQHLEDLRYQKEQEAISSRKKTMRQRAPKSQDTNFVLTDLKSGSKTTNTENTSSAKRPFVLHDEVSKHPVQRKAQTKSISDKPSGENNVNSSDKYEYSESMPQKFTITRGKTQTMVKLDDPTGLQRNNVGLPGEGNEQQKVTAVPPVEKQPKTDTKEKVTKEEVTKEETQKAMGEVASQVAANAAVADEEAYRYPPMELLQKGKASSMGDSDETLRKTAQKLQQTLQSFGVQVTVLDVSCGPAVTRYELQPEIGVKVSKIVGLADDIKLNLAVPDIRIEAPIPGKPAVGIEVPNGERSPVYLRELMESDELKKNKSVLAFPAGKDIAGNVIVADLAKMPHMLVAGTTGSGKSVFTNTVILSMLYRAKPSELRLIIIDPKVVEFGVYNGIPHLMIPVVTDPKKAAGALNWAVAEMSERYKKFADLQVRDLNGYNKKIDSLKDIPLAEGEVRPEKLPKIVIIIDELADLMMVAAKEVEDAICRLAQLARAAGIHMIIATQRPSVDVVTGLIKANIPSRVALSVASGTDSRTILDMNGAEKLLGNGDMLFYPSGYPKPIRVQGAFVSDTEVGNIIGFLKEQNQTVIYNKEIEEKMNGMQLSASGTSGSGAEDDRDEYFADAGKFIIEKDKASIGMLQRVFKIGFNRAARIMDQLAEAGVVGEEEGTKPRKILMSMTDFENLLEEI